MMHLCLDTFTHLFVRASYNFETEICNMRLVNYLGECFGRNYDSALQSYHHTLQISHTKLFSSFLNTKTKTF